MTGPFSWIHPEPTALDPTLADGVAARIADPLWLLARQLGFGELTGTDGGSSVIVHLTGETSQLARFRAGAASDSTAAVPIDDTALEPVIEAEADPAPRIAGNSDPPRRLLDAARAGLHFLRLLRGSGIPPAALTAYQTQLAMTYPLADPAATTGGSPLLRLYVGHVPDGQALYPALSGLRATPPQLPATTPLPANGLAALIAPGRAWLDWFDATCGLPAGLAAASQPTWQPTRLEYQAAIAAPGPSDETVLVTGEHNGGTLDWFDFDIARSTHHPNSPVSLGATGLPPAPFALTALPAPAAYPGMPRPRFWQFEDGAVNFGDITAPVEGVLTAVVVDYALRFGNDHFVLPVPLATGTLLRLTSLVVTTTFGDRILIPSLAELEPQGPFRLFEHAPTAADGLRDPLFVLFPTVGEVLSGGPVEEVDFANDELAEIVWGIERTALDPLGIPVDRATRPTGSAAPPPPPDDALRIATYALRTDVEPNWFPFILSATNAADQNVLRRIAVEPVDPVAAPAPWGSILSELPDGQALLRREEVSETGVQVARAWRYARWTDGRQLCWLSRHTRPGRGTTTSGLQYDVTSPTQ